MHFTRRKRSRFTVRIISAVILLAFSTNLILPSQAFAQAALNLPQPGTMIGLSPAFMPPTLRGITVHPDDPLRFDFIVDMGDENLKDDELKKESETLVRYFLAALTLPENDLWVNLSPYEKDRIAPEKLSVTELGRDLLAQDYILKQLTASLIYPESGLGKKFWDKIYKKAREKYGTAEIPVNTFNKVWVVPEKAVVYEHNGTAFNVDSHLKVMLEEDYVALSSQPSAVSPLKAESRQLKANTADAAILRELIVPEIEKEVNTGKNFARLRQIYNSVILAAWFKQNLKESLLGRVYADRSKVSGVDVTDKAVKEQIYQQYLEAYKKGAYNYIKEEYDPASEETIPRKYFSGGNVMNVISQDALNVHRNYAMMTAPDRGKLNEAFGRRSRTRSVEVQMGEIGEPALRSRDRAMIRTLSSLDEVESALRPLIEQAKAAAAKQDEEDFSVVVSKAVQLNYPVAQSVDGILKDLMGRLIISHQPGTGYQVFYSPDTARVNVNEVKISTPSGDRAMTADRQHADRAMLAKQLEGIELLLDVILRALQKKDGQWQRIDGVIKNFGIHGSSEKWGKNKVDDFLVLFLTLGLLEQEQPSEEYVKIFGALENPEILRIFKENGFEAGWVSISAGPVHTYTHQVLIPIRKDGPGPGEDLIVMWGRLRSALRERLEILREILSSADRAMLAAKIIDRAIDKIDTALTQPLPFSLPTRIDGEDAHRAYRELLESKKRELVQLKKDLTEGLENKVLKAGIDQRLIGFSHGHVPRFGSNTTLAWTLSRMLNSLLGQDITEIFRILSHSKWKIAEGPWEQFDYQEFDHGVGKRAVITDLGKGGQKVVVRELVGFWRWSISYDLIVGLGTGRRVPLLTISWTGKELRIETATHIIIETVSPSDPVKDIGLVDDQIVLFLDPKVLSALEQYPDMAKLAPILKTAGIELRKPFDRAMLAEIIDPLVKSIDALNASDFPPGFSVSGRDPKIHLRGTVLSLRRLDLDTLDDDARRHWINYLDSVARVLSSYTGDAASVKQGFERLREALSRSLSPDDRTLTAQTSASTVEINGRKYSTGEVIGKYREYINFFETELFDVIVPRLGGAANPNLMHTTLFGLGKGMLIVDRSDKVEPEDWDFSRDIMEHIVQNFRAGQLESAERNVKTEDRTTVGILGIRYKGRKTPSNTHENLRELSSVLKTWLGNEILRLEKIAENERTLIGRERIAEYAVSHPLAFKDWDGRLQNIVDGMDLRQGVSVADAAKLDWFLARLDVNDPAFLSRLEAAEKKYLTSNWGAPHVEFFRAASGGEMGRFDLRDKRVTLWAKKIPPGESSHYYRDDAAGFIYAVYAAARGTIRSDEGEASPAPSEDSPYFRITVKRTVEQRPGDGKVFRAAKGAGIYRTENPSPADGAWIIYLAVQDTSEANRGKRNSVFYPVSDEAKKEKGIVSDEPLYHLEAGDRAMMSDADRIRDMALRESSYYGVVTPRYIATRLGVSEYYVDSILSKAGGYRQSDGKRFYFAPETHERLRPRRNELGIRMARASRESFLSGPQPLKESELVRNLLSEIDRESLAGVIRRVVNDEKFDSYEAARLILKVLKNGKSFKFHTVAEVLKAASVEKHIDADRFKVELVKFLDWQRAGYPAEGNGSRNARDRAMGALEKQLKGVELLLKIIPPALKKQDGKWQLFDGIITGSGIYGSSGPKRRGIVYNDRVLVLAEGGQWRTKLNEEERKISAALGIPEVIGILKENGFEAGWVNFSKGPADIYGRQVLIPLQASGKDLVKMWEDLQDALRERKKTLHEILLSRDRAMLATKIEREAVIAGIDYVLKALDFLGNIAAINKELEERKNAVVLVQDDRTILDLEQPIMKDYILLELLALSEQLSKTTVGLLVLHAGAKAEEFVLMFEQDATPVQKVQAIRTLQELLLDRIKKIKDYDRAMTADVEQFTTLFLVEGEDMARAFVEGLYDAQARDPYSRIVALREGLKDSKAVRAELASEFKDWKIAVSDIQPMRNLVKNVRDSLVRRAENARKGGELVDRAMLSDSEVEQRVINMANDLHFGKGEPVVTLETHLVNDLGLDSFTTAQWVFDLEEEFEINLSDDEVDGLATVGQFVTLVQRKLSADRAMINGVEEDFNRIPVGQEIEQLKNEQEGLRAEIVRLNGTLTDEAALQRGLKQRRIDEVDREITDLSAKAGDRAMMGDPVGGIDITNINASLQIKRDGNGVALPINQQPLETINANFQGFVPLIINIRPMTNLPMLLGVAKPEAEHQLTSL